MTTKIYHNPQCSKSRATLALLEEQGVTLTIVRYLETPPSRAELVLVLEALNLSPRDLMRTGEQVYRDLAPIIHHDVGAIAQGGSIWLGGR